MSMSALVIPRGLVRQLVNATNQRLIRKTRRQSIFVRDTLN
jgi:hypothetical protein